jgi:hypothetical protein
VIGISLAGAVLLWTTVPIAKHNGHVWCFGASLSRLLPVIEINKEFADFFNDPRVRTGLAHQPVILYRSRRVRICSASPCAVNR